MENRGSEAGKVIYQKYPINAKIPSLPFRFLHRLPRLNLFRIIVVT